MKSTTFFYLSFLLSSISIANGEVDICFSLKKDRSKNSAQPTEISELLEKCIDAIENGPRESKKSDPVSVNYTDFHLNFSHPAVTLEGHLTDGTMTIDDQTVKLFTFVRRGFEIFNLTFPSIYIDGSYNFAGYVGAHRLFDIYGNGPFSLQMNNFSVSVVTSLKVNLTALCIPLTIEVYVNDVKTNFENFMNGDEQLCPLLNGAIEAIVPDAVRIIFREYLDAADPQIQSIIDSLLHSSKLSVLLEPFSNYAAQLKLLLGMFENSGEI